MIRRGLDQNQRMMKYVEENEKCHFSFIIGRDFGAQVSELLFN